MDKKIKPFISQEEVGTIGSYSSFLALLLVATVLAYREIFDTIVDLAQNGLPISLVYLVFAVMMVVFIFVFVLLPSIPIVRDIRISLKINNRRLGWLLIFVIVVYDFAILFQLIHAYIDKFVK